MNSDALIISLFWLPDDYVRLPEGKYGDPSKMDGF